MKEISHFYVNHKMIIIDYFDDNCFMKDLHVKSGVYVNYYYFEVIPSRETIYFISLRLTLRQRFGAHPHSHYLAFFNARRVRAFCFVLCRLDQSSQNTAHLHSTRANQTQTLPARHPERTLL